MSGAEIRPASRLHLASVRDATNFRGVTVAIMASWRLAMLVIFLILGCSPTSAPPTEAEAIKRRYGSYTLERAAQEGYMRDEFCLDAAAFGQPAQQGAMGFHATNEALLRGPIDRDRPQALMFDAQGNVLGVEYEVTTDAVPEAPQLLGRTFARLPAHPGVQHEHYALHLWFVDNPAGAFADFNPKVSCPPTSPPSHAPAAH